MSASPSQTPKHTDINPGPELTKCDFDSNGFCRLHRGLGTLEMVEKEVWKDRGGGRGYRYVKMKKKEFVCFTRKSSSRQPAVAMLSAWLRSDRLTNERAGNNFGREGDLNLIGRHLGDKPV